MERHDGKHGQRILRADYRGRQPLGGTYVSKHRENRAESASLPKPVLKPKGASLSKSTPMAEGPPRRRPQEWNKLAHLYRTELDGCGRYDRVPLQAMVGGRENRRFTLGLLLRYDDF